MRRRALLAAASAHKPDYLTIIPDNVPTTLILGFPAITYDDGDVVEKDFQLIYISKDNGNTWETYRGGEEKEYITIDGPIKIKANLKIDGYISEYIFMTPPSFDLNTTFTVEGSPMSLCYGDDFDSYTGKQTWSFYNMFYNSNIRRINNPKTFLPATSFRYSDDTMRSYPAYEEMFWRCSKLENAPEINLINIGSRDCANMFYACTSLTTAADINSISVGTFGCYYMYAYCENLVKAQNVLPMTINGYNCYANMFRGCPSLVRAPELPSLTLTSKCYEGMFYECKKLNYIKANFTTTPGSSYTNNWLYGVASTGTFVKNKNATWNVTGVSGIPSGWTVISE